MEFTKTEQSLYYGFSFFCFSVASYKLSGGAFNLSLIMGGMIFDRQLTINLVGMFLGSFFGCLTAKMFYYQFLRRKPKKYVEDSLLSKSAASKNL